MLRCRLRSNGRRMPTRFKSPLVVIKSKCFSKRVFLTLGRPLSPLEHRSLHRSRLSCHTISWSKRYRTVETCWKSWSSMIPDPWIKLGPVFYRIGRAPSKPWTFSVNHLTHRSAKSLKTVKWKEKPLLWLRSTLAGIHKITHIKCHRCHRCYLSTRRRTLCLVGTQTSIR